MSCEVCTSIWIKASPAQAWAALTDFSSYPAWNPFIREVKGTLATGELLRFKVAKGGGAETDAMARLLCVDPESELAWGGGSHLGLFRARHSFSIVAENSGVVVQNREVFSGPLARLLIKPERLRMQRQAFEMQDIALKQWLERPQQNNGGIELG